MYRKSMHNRVGYYDESFRGAGDTEFKNRVLPYINVKHINKLLGVFINYPEERTTASPAIEIEDLRAWYAYRTKGGVRYTFENRTLNDAENLLHLALGYRKSYCSHISCDIEYAFYLSQYINNQGKKSIICDDLEKMLSNMRKLEFTEIEPSKAYGRKILMKAWKESKRFQDKHNKLFPGDLTARYVIFNDNRYEQHSWLWKSEE